MNDMKSSDNTQKYCIIGAGPSGIAAAKNLKALGIPFDVIEREDEVGGNWYYGKPNSSVYKSTHLISSKPMSGFVDYPMPAHYADYPHHKQVLAYLRDYTRHFGLYEHIELNTAAERIERADDGNWDVTISDANGTNDTQSRRYWGVIIANGHHWDAKYPEYRGTFDGRVIHSKDYKTPDILHDKRVLVVGAGNSGCDLAVEAAQNASRVFHSVRRGYYYIPKYIFGKPTDQVNEISVRMRVPLPIRRFVNGLLLKMTVGNPQRFGLPKPDHKLLESHPIVNSQMLYYVGHGDITPKPDIRELCGDRVRFKDGSEEPIDLIIYATGFRISFPFIDRKHLNWGNDGPRLFMHVFHPKYDNLFVAGLIQPDSGQFWITDYQCQLVAKFIHAQQHDRARAEAFRQVKAGPQPDLRGGRKHLNTARHFLEIDHFGYTSHLKKLIRNFG
jgi:cation diffusion facilitator CzcD-associated flavoprotein CzcO